MGSTGRDGGQKMSRKNTFQRMLELEKKNKMNRQKASTTDPIPSTRISIDRRPDSSPYWNPPPASLQSTRRAMTAPTFPVSIPPIEPSTNPSTTLSTFQTTDDKLKPGGRYFKDEERGSDTSSICQSPGWDDFETKKRKKAKKDAKEKRRKEKAEAATEAKHAQRVKTRLTKAPPTNKRLEQTAVSMERSSSAPAFQITSDVDRKAENRARRGSLEIGLKNLFQATQAFPVQWKFVQTPQAQEFRPSVDNGEFIGGLKLKLADEVAIQDRVRNQNSTIPSYYSAQETPTPEPESSNGKSTVQDGLRMHRYNVPKDQPIEQHSSKLDHATSRTIPRDENYGWSEQDEDPKYVPRDVTMHQNLGSVRSAQQWNSIYSQAATVTIPVETSHQSTSTATPIMDRKTKKKHENSGTISDHRSTRTAELTEVNGQRSPGPNNCFNPALSRPGDSDCKSNQTTNTTVAFSPVRTYFTHREAPIEPHRGRSRPASYMQRQRLQSRDHSAAGFEHQYLVSGANSAVPNRPRSRGGSVSYASTRTHGRSWSEATSSTRSPRNGNDGQNGSQERGRIQVSLRKDPTPPQSDFIQQQPPGSTDNENPVNDPKTTKSGPIVPLLKGFRSATKAIFSKPSSVASSPTSLFYPNDVKTSRQTRSGLSRRPSPVDTVKRSKMPLGKASRDQRPSTPSNFLQNDLDNDPPLHSGYTSRNNLSNLEQFLGDRAVQHNEIEKSHSRSMIDSSEEYSTLDESSYNTTPPASRPPSQKAYFPSPQEAEPETTKMKKAANGMVRNYSRNDLPLSMTKHDLTFESDVNAGNESGSSIQMPLRLNNGKERTMESMRKNGSTEPYTSSPMKANPGIGELQRQPSLSRSISRPELQDLSFLPPLKHQSLHRKDKGTAKEENPTKSLIKPLAPRLTKSEGFSPVSPVCNGQNLRDTGLNVIIPRASGHFPSATHQGPEVQSVAKMLVICCACHYFHDLPSKVYKCMAKPDSVVTDSDLGVSGVISTAVKCPWCGHGMSTSCCEGYTAVVYLRERLH